MQFELGEVIPIRQLEFVQEDGTKQIVLVKLGKAQQFPDSADYYAPFQITGLGSETILCAGGIDAVQAIQEAMLVIGAELLALSERSHGSLKWEGDEEGRLGFPIGGGDS